jgi:WSC domain
VLRALCVPFSCASASPWRPLGCFQDPDGSLMYPYPLASGPDVTVEACYLAAQQQGYPLFGLRSGNSCYGGTSRASVLPALGPPEACSTPCSGNPYATCGGEESLAVHMIGERGWGSASMAKHCLTNSTLRFELDY